MTDRELLELAAKAARYDLCYRKDGAVSIDMIHEWNPLNDDGDALRLAVKMGIEIGDWNQYQRGFAFLRYNGGLEFWDDDKDPYAATRRAIVMVAVEIGRGME
jgi:hypothetical protein